MTTEEKGRRKIRPGAIEADPKEMAILVHYEAEEIVDGTVFFLFGKCFFINTTTATDDERSQSRSSKGKSLSKRFG
jgi:hypothetical protein